MAGADGVIAEPGAGSGSRPLRVSVAVSSDNPRERLLLVSLVQLHGRLQPANAEPMGLGTLAAALGEQANYADVSLHVVHPTVPGRDAATVLNLWRAAPPDVVGVSVPQGCLAIAEDFMRGAREFMPRETLFIFGHALPTALPERFVRLADRTLVIEGWGEWALVEAVAQVRSGYLRPAEIPGVSFLEAGQLKRVPASPANWYLSQSPPVRIGDPNEYFRRVEASRGCHFGRCTFCTRPPGDPTMWRAVPVERIRADVEGLLKMGVNSFTFSDEDFVGFDLGHAMAVAAMLRNLRQGESRAFSFTASMRVDSLIDPMPRGPGASRRRAMLRELVASGLRQLFLGVESLSVSQLRRYGKAATPELNVAAVREAERHGVELEVGFIPFDPEVSLSELVENFTLLRDSGLYRYVSSPLNRMRIQFGSPVAARSKRLDPLRGRFDPETLETRWRFREADVGALYRTVSDAWSPVERAALLARNLYRSDALPPAGRVYLMSALEYARLSLIGLTLDAIHSGRLSLDEGDLLEATSSILTRFAGVERYFTAGDPDLRKTFFEYSAEMRRVTPLHGGAGSVLSTG